MIIDVTGAAGFLGSNLVSHLRRNGFEVVGFDTEQKEHLGYGSTRSLIEELKRSRRKHLVLHFGAHTNTQDNNRLALEEYNLKFTRELARTVKDFGHTIFFASSSAVYGNGKEPHLASLKNPYARSKLISEMELQEIFRETPNLKILRLYNVFGPGEFHKGSMMSIPSRFIMDAMSSGEIEIWNSRSVQQAQSRDFIFVEDLCKFIQLLINEEEKSEVIEVGSSVSRKFWQVAESVQNLVPCQIRNVDFPKQVIESSYQFFTKSNLDLSKRNSSFTYTTFDSALETTLDACKQFLKEGKLLR